MEKLIIIKDNSEIKVGDLVQHSETKELGVVYKDTTATNSLRVLYRNKEFKVNASTTLDKSWKKAKLHIVDTEAEINLHDYIKWFILPLNRNWVDKITAKDVHRYTLTNEGWKVIATSNPSLPLPQLSKQAIELIVEKNGELGEFDIDIIGETLYTQEQHFKRYKDWANIILKPLDILDICKRHDLDMNITKMYSEEEVLELLTKLAESETKWVEGMIDRKLLPNQIEDNFKQWFSNNKK